MRILVACEESQAVTIELRKLGHEAYSCDIIDCSGGHPEWHIKQDVLPLLNGNSDFKTCDGILHKIHGKWDMIIAFPPCTYLTPAGACNIPKHPERIELGFKAKEFFIKILEADCAKIAVENPPPMKRFNLPHYNQIIQPFQFGHPVNKKTALWLKGLPHLVPTDIIDFEPDLIVWNYKGQRKSCSRWYNTNTNNHSKHRSKTFPGVAKAMAEQWAGKN
jgi:hypothetical protein